VIRRRRLYLLHPWLVRVLIPERRAGAYMLYTAGRPVYAGRSDRDLQGRLITHACSERADYFGYEVYPDAERAYDMECALFHMLVPNLVNRVHPAAPAATERQCFICGHGDVLEDRAAFSRLAVGPGNTIMQQIVPSHPYVVEGLSEAFIPAETDHLTVSANQRR
jgi:hypothetical protein